MTKIKALIPLAAACLIGWNLCGQTQNIKVVDIGFGDFNGLSYGSWTIEYIERNELQQVLGYLAKEAAVDYNDIVAMSEFIRFFHREDERSFPPLMANSNYRGDTLFYERHYYTKDGENLSYLAQLVVKLLATPAGGEVIDVVLNKGSSFLDRYSELRALDDGTWNHQVASFRSTSTISMVEQSSDIDLTDYDRTIARNYVDQNFNVGFDYDTSQWAIVKEEVSIDRLGLVNKRSTKIDLLATFKLKEQPNEPFPVITVIRADLLRMQYDLEEISESLNSTLSAEGEDRLSGVLSDLEVNQTIIDKERDLLINKLAVEHTLGHKMLIIQAMFLFATESYLIQLTCEESNCTEEVLRHYSACINSFELK